MQLFTKKFSSLVCSPSNTDASIEKYVFKKMHKNQSLNYPLNMAPETNCQYSSRNTAYKREPTDLKNLYFPSTKNIPHNNVPHRFFKNSNVFSTRTEWNEIDSNIQTFGTTKHETFANQKFLEL